MKKEVLIKSLAIFLALLTIMPCLYGCDKNAEEPAGESSTEYTEESTEPEESAEPFILTKDGKANFTVIRPDEAESGDKVVELAKNVRDAVQKKIGATVNLGNDFVIPGQEHDAEKYEILVGITNYSEATELLADMKYSDATVALCGHKIVITSPSEAGLSRAASYFCTTVVPLIEQNEEGEYRLMFDNHTFYGNYKVSTLTINGHDLREYRIVYNGTTKLIEEGASTVQSIIATATGYMLPVVSDKNTEPQECEILVGSTNRLECTADIINYRIYLSGSRLVLDVAGTYSAEAAIRYLYAKKMSDGGDIALDSSLSLESSWREDEGLELTTVDGVTADLRIISYNILTIKWGGTATAPRAEGLGMLLATYRPDAMGIQEVCSEWVKYMQYYLGDYKLICNKFPNGSENYSSILYDASKYDVVDSGVVAYSKSANTLCRNMGWAIFRNKTTGKMFGLISTHWDFDNDTANREDYRRVQAEEMTAKVKELHEKYNCAIFTTGDYNSRQDSTSQAYFRSINDMYCALFDAKKKYTSIGSCNGSLGVKSPSVNSIDFVFGTKDAEMLGYKVITDNKTEYISDHLPVMADIKLPS